MQDSQFLTAAFACCVNGLLNFIGVGHTRGNDHGLAGAGNVLDQPVIDGFKGRDFVGWRVQVFQQINGCVVKRRAEDGDAQLVSVLKQRGVPIPRRVGLLVQVVKRAAVPQPTTDTEIFRIAVQRDGVGAVGLQLDGIGAGLFGGLDNFEGSFNVAVVVGGHFCDDVGRMRRVDNSIVDRDAVSYACHRWALSQVVVGLFLLGSSHLLCENEISTRDAAGLPHMRACGRP